MTLTTVTTTTSANNNSTTKALTKIYYPNPSTTNLKQSQLHHYPQQQQQQQHQQQQKILRKNNEIVQEQQRPTVHRASENNRVFNSGNILQYYYNNINNNNDFPITNTSYNSTGNAEYLSKQSNININNIFAMSGNQQKLPHEKNQFSSTNRPLSLKVVTPKHVSNFFMKTFRSDSQKRPLMLNCSTIRKNEFHVGDGVSPNFKIIPDKTGLKISPIYSISQNIDKYTTRKLRQQQSSYFRNVNNHGDKMMASCTRPLFVKKS